MILIKTEIIKNNNQLCPLTKNLNSIVKSKWEEKNRKERKDDKQYFLIFDLRENKRKGKLTFISILILNFFFILDFPFIQPNKSGMFELFYPNQHECREKLPEALHK